MKDINICFYSYDFSVLGVYFSKGSLRIIGRSLRYENKKHTVKNTIKHLHKPLQEFANKYRGGSLCIKDGKDDKYQRFLLDIEELKKAHRYSYVDRRVSVLRDILYEWKQDVGDQLDLLPPQHCSCIYW